MCKIREQCRCALDGSKGHDCATFKLQLRYLIVNLEDEDIRMGFIYWDGRFKFVQEVCSDLVFF